MQTVADEHETALGPIFDEPFRSVHFEPPHRSTRDLPNVRPTAVHAFTDVHDTASSSLLKLGRKRLPGVR